MGIVKSEILSIGDYLKNSTLKIPYFQRPYKWSTKNALQLVNDIQRFKSDTPYRIGTVVVNQENGHEEIVDGQQRTITFLLMLKVITENKLESLSEGLKNQIKEINKYKFNPEFDSDISKFNIKNNYLSMTRRLDIFDETFIDYFLNKCQITYFVIDDVSEAFQFFDSQNARGKDLEPHDLLKAFHLRELQSANSPIAEEEVVHLVKMWEDIDSDELAKLFAEYLYRIRGWAKGESSRYFTKDDTGLFKGITLETIAPYPYTQLYRNVDDYLNRRNIEFEEVLFPFQLDQTIINGKHFFKMISYYKELYDNLYSDNSIYSSLAKRIIDTINSYEGKSRTGDKYVRMIFDCALLFYVDKFGYENISKAIEKIFIWAYTIRLTYQALQLSSVDNYVVREFNIFKLIKESINPKAIEMFDLPLIEKENEHVSHKTQEIKNLFIEMNYYEA